MKKAFYVLLFFSFTTMVVRPINAKPDVHISPSKSVRHIDDDPFADENEHTGQDIIGSQIMHEAMQTERSAVEAWVKWLGLQSAGVFLLDKYIWVRQKFANGWSWLVSPKYTLT